MQSLSVILVVFAAILALTSGLALPNNQIFVGHSVLRIKVETQVHVKALRALESVHGILADFWLSPKRLPGTAHIRVTPENREKIIEVLNEAGMKHEIMVDDLQSLVNKEAESLAKRKVFKAGDAAAGITTNEFHNITEIHNYLDAVSQQYGYQVASIGKSDSQRFDLKYIKIGKNPNATREAFINGCIHAREWLGCATMVYIINELTTKPDQYDDLLQNLNIYVLPVLNPDGYDYTWTKDRMWRKTRSGPRQGCYGVDPNRNWDYKWGVAGSSSNPCSETYDGPAPNSEIEVQHITKFLGDHSKTMVSYFDIHTYSEDFMFPFGYAEVYPDDRTKIQSVASTAVLAVNAVNGENFVSGSITDIVYPASGSSIDYTKGKLKIDYSYAMELRPDGNAFNGFVLPEDQIVDGASECWAGVQVAFRAAMHDMEATG
uniref:Peptidase M14 carboxypeptidase A domain-containing protein n=1 Tax=Panagrolaimus sp. ES5 TaxID=591445 RepID=A0AC34F3D6_9BILA